MRRHSKSRDAAAHSRSVVIRLATVIITATIAAEMAEAVSGGHHYRILFLLGALLFGRWRFGWRGPRAVKLTLTAMLLLGLAFFGSKFVLENMLGRHWG